MGPARFRCATLLTPVWEAVLHIPDFHPLAQSQRFYAEGGSHLHYFFLPSISGLRFASALQFTSPWGPLPRSFQQICSARRISPLRPEAAPPVQLESISVRMDGECAQAGKPVL